MLLQKYTFFILEQIFCKPLSKYQSIKRK